MKSELQLTTKNEAETLIIGEAIGKSLKSGDIVALIGELGAGKTVLTKGIAKGLGIKDEPNSPTFVILNIYEAEIPLYHFDLYRISNIEELEGVGYKDYFFGDGVKVIEWADKIIDVLPQDTVIIEASIIESRNENSFNNRKLLIKGNEKWLSLFKNTVEQALQTLRK